MQLPVPRPQWLVNSIVPVCAGVAVWAWYGFSEGVLVAVVATVIVLSHRARSRAREQLIYRSENGHTPHADDRRGENSPQRHPERHAASRSER